MRGVWVYHDGGRVFEYWGAGGGRKGARDAERGLIRGVGCIGRSTSRLKGHATNLRADTHCNTRYLMELITLDITWP